MAFERIISVTLLEADSGTLAELRAKEYEADGTTLVGSEYSGTTVFSRLDSGLTFLFTKSYTIANNDAHFVKIYLNGHEDEEIGVEAVDGTGGLGGDGEGDGDTSLAPSN